nr:amidohydrolase family protein [Pyxidicoccus caerfyrddinensis]
MEGELESVVRLLAERRWPFRIHATYDESISRVLDVYEKVSREVPFDGLHWLIDHAETISERNIDRVRALQGGIAIQHRMAYQGEYFAERYGARALAQTPPVRRMLSAGVPVGAGTDATRVASYNPWVSLYWLVSGRTVGGLPMYGDDNRLEREEALRLWTHGSAWFSHEQDRKGLLKPGHFADFALLSSDFFSVPEDAIKDLTSVLTVVGGWVVHGTGEFGPLAPELPSPMPDWSPVSRFGGYQHAPLASAGHGLALERHTHAPGTACGAHAPRAVHTEHRSSPGGGLFGFWGALGCACHVF